MEILLSAIILLLLNVLGEYSCAVFFLCFMSVKSKWRFYYCVTTTTATHLVFGVGEVRDTMRGFMALSRVCVRPVARSRACVRSAVNENTSQQIPTHTAAAHTLFVVVRRMSASRSSLYRLLPTPLSIRYFYALIV